jgi:methionyl-tRNA formyltransferase
MDLVFFGSGAFGLPTLRALADRHTVRAVVTQPDRPAGRGKKLTPNPIAEFAQTTLGVPVLKPERASAEGPREQIRAFPADAWVVIAFGQKLSPALLADRFAINLHASLLPRWRGAAPIHHAILAGDAVTGNSVITLADRMDAGLVLGTTTRPIDPAITTGELHDLLAADGPELVLRVLDQHRAATLAPVVQDESLVTLAGKLSRGDAQLDPAASADALRSLINGLSPWPGVTALLAGEPIKLLRAAADAVQSAPPHAENIDGPALTDRAAGTFRCRDGSTLRLLELQPPGGRPMDWPTYARGRVMPGGTALLPSSAP